MRLQPVSTDDLDAIERGAALDHPAAPGWPHEDSLIGLSYVRSGAVGFLVVDDADRIAGECGTKAAPNADGGVEIGYGLAGPSRGRGLGTRAVAALIDWLAAQPGIRYVEAEIHETNTASRRLVERLGFAVHSGPDHGYLHYRKPLPPK